MTGSTMTVATPSQLTPVIRWYITRYVISLKQGKFCCYFPHVDLPSIFTQLYWLIPPTRVYVEESELNSWDQLLPDLTQAYIEWKYPHPIIPSAQVDVESSFHLPVYDIFTTATTLRVDRPSTSTSPVVDVARHGYLSRSPNMLKLAISFRSLELFHRLRLRKPSFSMEAFAKVLIDYYDVG